MKAEWLLLLIPIGMLILWAVWFRFTTWLYNKKYKPENDKGRRPTANLGFPEARNRRIEKTDLFVPRPSELEDRGELQIPTPSSITENSSGFRGFFARRRSK